MPWSERQSTVNSELRNRQLVFVDDLASPVLREADYAHLSRSLRIKEGTEIIVSDGRGSWRVACFGQTPTVASEIFFAPKSPEVTLCFAPVKNVRTEWVVQKLTELGVSRIVPFVSKHSVVHWDEKRVHKNHKKQVTVSREAAMQSRNIWLPSVEPLTTFAELSKASSFLSLADPIGEPIHQQDRTICIGPEGGFSAQELSECRKVSLPGGILRAETAVLAAAVLAISLHS